MNAWMPSARPSATKMITTSSMIGLAADFDCFLPELPPVKRLVIELMGDFERFPSRFGPEPAPLPVLAPVLTRAGRRREHLPRRQRRLRRALSRLRPREGA